MSGKIFTVTSTMFGGKSVYALHLMETLSIAYSQSRVDTTPGANNLILYINHQSDTRAESPYSTHSAILTPHIITKINADFVKRPDLNLTDEFISKYKTIIIDEAQFFSDLIDRVLHFAEDLGIDVYAMGLTTNYKRQPFGSLGVLRGLADENIELRNTYCGVCATSGIMNKALFTHRRVDNSHQEIEIGADNYIAVCRGCYLNLNRSKI